MMEAMIVLTGSRAGAMAGISLCGGFALLYQENKRTCCEKEVSRHLCDDFLLLSKRRIICLKVFPVYVKKK
jgi:hypothetical protein